MRDRNVFMYIMVLMPQAMPIKNFLQEKNIDVLDWLVDSRNLNAIENL